MYLENSFTVQPDVHAAIRLIAGATGESPDILASKILQKYLDETHPTVIPFLKEMRDKRADFQKTLKHKNQDDELP